MWRDNKVKMVGIALLMKKKAVVFACVLHFLKEMCMSSFPLKSLIQENMIYLCRYKHTKESWKNAHKIKIPRRTQVLVYSAKYVSTADIFFELVVPPRRYDDTWETFLHLKTFNDIL